MRKLVGVLVVVGCLVFVGAASSVTLKYPKFSNARGLKLNGDAELTGASGGNRLGSSRQRGARAAVPSPSGRC